MGYGAYGVLSERTCPSDGLLAERYYDDNSPSSTWWSYNAWAAASAMESLAERILASEYRTRTLMASQHSFRGLVVPMVSPFTPDGRIDEPAVERIVNHLVAGGVHGIFPLGTTGEAASIRPQEKQKLVAVAVQAAGNHATVYAGIASNCLQESIEAARIYAEIGADAFVAHPPCYYPLTDQQIETYFSKLADQVPRPLVLYNIPATAHQSISLDAIGRLRKHPNIVAIKDSAADAGSHLRIAARVRRSRRLSRSPGQQLSIHPRPEARRRRHRSQRRASGPRALSRHVRCRHGGSLGGR